jgi:PPOX class probable F420-dependent enzyme
MSRRKQIEMSADEVRSFLAGSRTVILVSNGHNGHPHPMPMWFVLDPDGGIRMTTYAASQKVRNLERDPRVTLMAEAGEVYEQLRGVVLYGKAELVRDVERILDTLLVASANVAPDLDAERRRAVRESLRPMAAKRVLVRVVPDQVVSWDHRKLGGTY